MRARLHSRPRDLRVCRHRHDFLLPRVWEPRFDLTAYDAVYVALAEALGAPLVTRDRCIAGAAGHRARVELI
jgi:predicted nucleic acid-binding protein